MQLLLCSSSGYQDSEYLSHTRSYLEPFLAHQSAPISRALFIPYAGVTKTFSQYLAQVKPFFASFGIELSSIDQYDDAKAAVKDAPMIIVGGGNTFALLKRLQDAELIELIQQKVQAGTPYMGWSAGSNLSGLSISTTNDMPIVEPQSFNALSLVPFLINPHFISGQIPGHNGESREQRLAEYMVMNPEQTVVALPEGCALYQNGTNLTLLGPVDALQFRAGKQSTITLGDCSSLLKEPQ
ncbi:dipeptidase PepE [Celerinatantimonas sp. MCCC 1A17872]|uniref:dipeptidase PepE n=1 Tax=Celerinatantimonas sp. MCCC 1A17872 TaxID=3177514 RepID=UPI0038C11829